MLLGRPLFISVPLTNQQIARSASDNFFQSRRRPSQTRTQVRMPLHRKSELKPSFKPGGRAIHVCGQSIPAF
jgi:hypothetical protein